MASVWFENPHCDVFDVGNQCKAAQSGAAGPQCPGLLPGGHPVPRLSGRFASLSKQQGVNAFIFGGEKTSKKNPKNCKNCNPSQRCCSKGQAAFGQCSELLKAAPAIQNQMVGTEQREVALTFVPELFLVLQLY